MTMHESKPTNLQELKNIAMCQNGLGENYNYSLKTG